MLPNVAVSIISSITEAVQVDPEQQTHPKAMKSNYISSAFKSLFKSLG